ncbi:MAG: murein biosynthesis integral membrane protein MurJ [Proteobacteria bacterium]|nr:MAG: murein biosynthesis integral membrane protein MurJ [Pseudomonadota bacterium]
METQHKSSDRLPDKPAPAAGSSRLIKSGATVAAMTMLSRVFGLIRDVVIARVFGAGAATDAFFVAFKIPNFLRRLFAEGAFAQAFVPVLSEYKVKHGYQEVKSLVDTVAGSLGLVLLVVTVLACAGAPYVTWLFAPGFADQPEKFALAADILRITFPYLLMISLTAFAGSVLNSYGRFAAAAFTPVLLNLSLISCAIWVAPLFEQGVMALAWGVFIAGALQLFFQFPFLLRLHLLPRPRVDYGHEGVKRILALMLPALIGVSVSQINLLLDTILASFLESGSVSWLYYSDRLTELPLGVIGIAIGTVILPSLSRSHASESPDAFSGTVDWALRCVLLIGLPASLALVVLAEPLIATLFYYGEMQARDVTMSSHSLAAYALGLQAFMLIKVLAPGYFSRQDTKTPVKIGIIAMVANMVLNLCLIWNLAHVGLALATSLSAWLNMALLLRGLWREKVYIPRPGWRRFLIRLVIANGVMVAILLVASPATPEWMSHGAGFRAGTLAWLVPLGMVSYFGLLLLMGVNLKSLYRERG